MNVCGEFVLVCHDVDGVVDLGGLAVQTLVYPGPECLTSVFGRQVQQELVL